MVISSTECSLVHLVDSHYYNILILEIKSYFMFFVNMQDLWRVP
jgi:hypothetical protein